MIADHFGGIAIAFESPCGDDLSTCLLDRAKIEKRLRHGKSRFLLKFTFRSLQGELAVKIFALRDGPCSQVLFRKEGAARVDEEDLQTGRAAPIHHQTRTSSWHKR